MEIITMDIVKHLKFRGEEAARAGHYGWGNTMLLAAYEIERLQGNRPPDIYDVMLKDMFEKNSGIDEDER